MDELDQREALLKAIFATPRDDLPRLVFADWLEEHGEGTWAELIRVQCALHQLRRLPKEHEQRAALLRRSASLTLELPFQESAMLEARRVRGFLNVSSILCHAEYLAHPIEFRRNALLRRPEFYGVSKIKVINGVILGAQQVHTILHSPALKSVQQLELSGDVKVLHDPDAHPDWDQASLTGQGFEYQPTVTLQAVEALVKARECRRFTRLDLRNNDLDNDAARAIVHSTNLTRLVSLQIFEGNQLRGRTWQQLLDKFGEDVVQ